MDRRDALQALTTIVAATGATLTPITTHHASTDVALIVLKCSRKLTAAQVERLGELLPKVLKDTPLEGVKCLVLPDMDLEIVRSRDGA